MTNLIDDIKRDREAGTSGPWSAPGSMGVEVAGPNGEYVARVISSTSAHNARRIARVPALEEALLAAVELDRCVQLVSAADEVHDETKDIDDLYLWACAVRDEEMARAAFRKALEKSQ